MDWRHNAVCREEDPELFFPIGNTGPALLQIEEAKAVCRRCPVIEQCLQWALESGQDSGVWGGLSEDERRAMTAAERLALDAQELASEVAMSAIEAMAEHEFQLTGVRPDVAELLRGLNLASLDETSPNSTTEPEAIEESI